jgi:hypothetical protein
VQKPCNSGLRGALSPHDGGLPAHEARGSLDLLVSEIRESLAVFFQNFLAGQGKVQVLKAGFRVLSVAPRALGYAANIAL